MGEIGVACYGFCVTIAGMKTEHITFRPKLRKAEVARLAQGNISRWLNRLIEQEHAREAGGVDPEAHWRAKAARKAAGEKGVFTSLQERRER